MDEQEFAVAGSSLSSRLWIFLDSGIEQLAVNPLFGDLAVDHVVGKPGYYIHSVFAIQTHLGIVGSILFFSFLFERTIALYRSNGNVFIKTLFPPILATATIGALFTWMPLWFLVGALYSIDYSGSGRHN